MPWQARQLALPISFQFFLCVLRVLCGERILIH